MRKDIADSLIDMMKQNEILKRQLTSLIEAVDAVIDAERDDHYINEMIDAKTNLYKLVDQIKKERED